MSFHQETDGPQEMEEIRKQEEARDVIRKGFEGLSGGFEPSEDGHMLEGLGPANCEMTVVELAVIEVSMNGQGIVIRESLLR